MLPMLVPLIFTVLLTETSASLPSSGRGRASPCPPRWLLFRQRCFAFYPVWSSWSTADAMCSQSGGNLASLHTSEERQFVSRLVNTHTAGWLGGYQSQQNLSWIWSDYSPFTMTGWTNQRQENARGGGACIHMELKSGELHSAPCGELKFYICSTRASSTVVPKESKPVEPGIIPSVSVFDVVWGYSDVLAEEILHSSSFLKELRSGQLTQRCYDSFTKQEALYLHRVSGTLEALISSLQEADDMRSLLLDTLKHYSSRNQSLLASPPPQWLRLSLQSFHSVVLEEPVYWLVALSARACLRNFLDGEQLFSELKPGSLLVSEAKVKAGGLYQEWREESLKEVAWTQRYRKVIEEHQDQMNVFKAVTIFREQMMNQKSFYKAVACDVVDDR
ncbi:uncharacterized protein LOC118337773 isoform X2 [Morone saxatilis]|uniref:uncharacterized protein LOC118337773 isoform X2 n=1 Tax=Morone saxatilis TaxID=34816 RepID=UPI0015E1DC8F|nr:uncharacterized protein LOC118337773 isoform X2 [Morone saxatilis]XP_035530775.1 uncharacterized protein LOC118337773 isoform X2 [Morone saxatilis]